jgi:hypothetical protein
VAGISVVVCLPPEASKDLARALADAPEPFRLMCVPEWRGIWDWWAVRGGSDGSGFKTLPGHEDDPRLIHDGPRYDGEPLPSPFGWCAGGPRGLLDLSAFRMNAPVWVMGEHPRFWQPDLLTLDRWWIEDGVHHRHGTCDDESCTHMVAGRQYQRDVYDYLESLADDALIVKLKCHG